MALPFSLQQQQQQQQLVLHRNQLLVQQPVAQYVASSIHHGYPAEQIIQSAEELSILEYKLTALEVAKEN